MKTLEHPYVDFHLGHWMRGNLHTHSTQSDGKRPVQEVVNDYAARGYGFLMMSDHDVLTLPQYGTIDAKGMVLIPGNEITARGPHMLHVNARERIEPVADRQVVIDAALASGGFIIANHPNWEGNFNHFSIEQLRKWSGYAGVEIFNGVIQRLEGTSYATDKWDMLLSQGRRVWGFANDDSHEATGDVELGWNTALVRDTSVSGVVEALASGRFYPSTGVVIADIDVKGMTISIRTENADRIVAYRQNGARLAHVDADEMTFEVPEGVKYVRFECWGRGEKFAWTQPFWVVEG